MLNIKGHAVPQGHYIDGAWVEGTKTYSNFSPINGEALGELPVGSQSNVDAAISCRLPAMGSPRRTRQATLFAALR
jgi:acyl-CoA reductase-like NAD-dependent aldehyde dehydrogenase